VGADLANFNQVTGDDGEENHPGWNDKKDPKAGRDCGWAEVSIPATIKSLPPEIKVSNSNHR
jgi:hypothetical protein